MRNTNHFLCLLIMFLGLAIGLSPSTRAGDWPQILGPGRDGQAVDEQPLTSWDPSGPQELWTYELGQGFAGPAVAGQQVIIFHRISNSERVEAIDRKTGKRLWKTDFEASYQGTYNPDHGPRCVPLIHDHHVYLFGAAGELHCVRLSDGSPRWSRSTYEEFSGQDGYFGAGSTPIVADQKLLVNIGGSNAGLVAFDLETGKTVWKATQEAASYSSPTSATIAGESHVFFVTRMSALSVNPSNGKVKFRFPFGQSGPTVNAATPLVFENHLFVSAAYGVGANLSRIDNQKATTVWSNDSVMSSQYSTCVYRDGYLYGTHGREDFNNGELRCVEAMTGNQKWRVAGFGTAHTILVGKHLLLLNSEGQLRLANTNPSQYIELASAQISSSTTRALPAFSNGVLFLRDNNGSTGTLRGISIR